MYPIELLYTGYQPPNLAIPLGTVGGQIKLGHLKFNQCKSDH
jgi:hypothetical protein